MRGDELRKWVLVESALRASIRARELRALASVHAKFSISSSCSSVSIYSMSSASSDSDYSDLTTPPDSPTAKVEDFDDAEDFIVISPGCIFEDMRYPYESESTKTTDIASPILNTRVLC